ncbi:Cof-type HAD-IIB family hydrolase [Treponema sp.]|uniref:Cof-type HAD-IIB family hydrolase n=1 Tax=Treponema sp. TaxID=166 RepID=UPI00298E7B7C|nr:Cof-type HAD-IIB family hydrolase [Treponema sp.]MCR5613492.1 Cof-type HAD-IIB family hydrolase [Treponema sp.]
MENISIILSDLDGTLFHNDKSISDFTKQIIRQAQSNGIKFGICTSRAKINAIKFLDGIEPDILITNGGGIVYCDDKKIYDCEFTPEETRRLIDATFEVFGKDIVISTDNEHALYSNSKEELGDKYWTYNDFSDFQEPCMKLCIESQDKEKIEKVASVIGLEEIDYLPFSDIPWYKLSKKAATKENAISQLCRYLNITPAKIAAFGDDFNDIGMLKLCGKGIAMENAIEEVKKAADQVCDSNENDGVAKWIKKYL